MRSFVFLMMLILFGGTGLGLLCFGFMFCMYPEDYVREWFSHLSGPHIRLLGGLLFLGGAYSLVMLTTKR